MTGVGFKVVGEDYEGDGVFYISAFKYGAEEPVTITYIMDCNCEPTDIKVYKKGRTNVSSNKIHRCGRTWNGYRDRTYGMYGDYCCMACYADYYPN